MLKWRLERPVIGKGNFVNVSISESAPITSEACVQFSFWGRGEIFSLLSLFSLSLSLGPKTPKLQRICGANLIENMTHELRLSLLGKKEKEGPPQGEEKEWRAFLKRRTTKVGFANYRVGRKLPGHP